MQRIILLTIWLIFGAGSARGNEVALFETDAAVASFVSIESPCVTTSSTVFVSNHVVRFDETSTSGAFITLQRRDHCNGVDLLDAVGAPVFAASEFKVGGNLKTALLSARISLHDFVSGGTLTAEIQLKWARTSRLLRSWTLSSDDFVFIVAKEAKKTYLATASGEITIAGANLIPDPSQNAAISADQNLFVIRP